MLSTRRILDNHSVKWTNMEFKVLEERTLPSRLQSTWSCRSFMEASSRITETHLQLTIESHLSFLCKTFSQCQPSFHHRTTTVTIASMLQSTSLSLTKLKPQWRLFTSSKLQTSTSGSILRKVQVQSERLNETNCHRTSTTRKLTRCTAKWTKKWTHMVWPTITSETSRIRAHRGHPIESRPATSTSLCQTTRKLTRTKADHSEAHLPRNSAVVHRMKMKLMKSTPGSRDHLMKEVQPQRPGGDKTKGTREWSAREITCCRCKSSSQLLWARSERLTISLTPRWVVATWQQKSTMTALVHLRTSSTPPTSRTTQPTCCNRKIIISSTEPTPMSINAQPSSTVWTPSTKWEITI